MHATPFRTFTAAALLLAGGSAMAENYTAVIYGAPSPYNQMFVVGAGDNALMSGSVSTNGGLRFAAYLTNKGFKLMHPSGWYRSEIQDSWGSTYHAGYGRSSVSANNHALFWVGGGSAVDLHPSGAMYQASEAEGGGGQQQVGNVTGNIPCTQCGIDTVIHAALWSRTAASFSRLHSTTHQHTFGVATDGTTQVGYGSHRTDGTRNALIWKGAGSFSTNIRPSGSTESIAKAVWGNQQGGYFVGIGTAGKRHAVIWSGTAASAVDIHPSPFEHSHVNAIRNGLQVGYGNPIGTSRFQAIAWHGNAATWINLHARLPAPFNLWDSRAEGIDNLGNIVGYLDNPNGQDIRPVIWVRS